MTLRLPNGQHVLRGNCFDQLDGLEGDIPEVTVVIPYFEAQAELDLVLDALTAQNYPQSRFEVIVVDDGSAVPPVIGNRGLNAAVLSQPRDGFRAAAARNLGAGRAQGSVLCFLDGDTVPLPGYLTAAVRLPSLCPDAMVVGRRSHVDLSGWTPARLSRWRGGQAADPRALEGAGWLDRGYADSRNLLDADDRSFRFVISSVLTVGRDLFRELDGFDETFTSYGGEDWELAARAWNAGAVLAHEPRAHAWHSGAEWAGRGGSRSAKNAETMLLAGLITAAGTRGRGVRHEFPAWVVTVEATGWSPAALYLTVDALLTGADAGVWIAGGPDIFPADPRVRSGTPPPEALMRATRVAEVIAPCAIELAALPDFHGSLTVGDATGPLISAWTTRARARARRWAACFPDRDVVAELFDERSTASVGRLPAEPDLAGWFGGWAHGADSA